MNLGFNNIINLLNQLWNCLPPDFIMQDDKSCHVLFIIIGHSVPRRQKISLSPFLLNRIACGSEALCRTLMKQISYIFH
jgi:hypothetical protein